MRRFKLHSWRLLILIDEKQVNKTSKGYSLRSQIKTSKYSGKSPFAFAMLFYAEGEGNAWVFQEFLARIVRGVKGHLERFPFNPKFWKLRLVHTSGHFGRQDRNGPTLGTRGFFSGATFVSWVVSETGNRAWKASGTQVKMDLSIWQNCCPQYRSFVSCLQEQ